MQHLISIQPCFRPLLVLAFAPLASAQAPYFPRPRVLVTDSTNDRIAFVDDTNGDGDYLDGSDSVVFYDDNLGTYPLSNNAGIAAAKDGTVFVSDSSTDQILRLRDLDGDGTANGFGESTLFFESLTNAAGIEMIAAAGMDLGGGTLWVAVSQSGTSGKDFVLRLADGNGDGDAQDLGEAREYFVRSDLSQGGASNDSLVQDVHVGLDGRVYYLELGTSGVYAKGIWRLDDADGNGTIDPLTEVASFFLPPPQAAQPFFWTIDQGADGAWYVADTGNELIWRALDSNGDGVVAAGEASVWWSAGTSSLIWSVRMGADGWLYAGESQNNERIFALKDLDGSGSIDAAGEWLTLFDELTALGAPIGQLRGFVLEPRWLDPGEAYCTAQTNSLGCTPAISDSGTPSASFGSGYFVTASNLRNNKAGLLFYGTSGRASAPFGGGTMCVASPRLRTPVQSSAGSPSGDDCTGSFSFDFNSYIATGADPALVEGVLVDAQYWSRDPGAPPSNTNLTDALEFELLR